MPLSKVWEIYQIMKHRLSKDVFGRDSDWDRELYGEDGLGTLQMIITAILCGGHVLLEDYPGSGKSFLAVKLAACIEDDIPEEGFDIPAYKRIQCVPDLLPSDILGFHKPAMNSEPARFVHGPIFAYFLLLDEINRTTPKVQSAMLEAMAEGNVTVEGERHELGELFFFIATENPLDKVGTYPLPGASLDRFLFKRTLEPISKESTVKIILDYGADGGLGERAFEHWCSSQNVVPPVPKKDESREGWTKRKIKVTELNAAKKAVTANVSLSNATINALLKVDELIQGCYHEPIDSPLVKDSRITFQEGSRPSPRTLKRLAGALKVMALICKGEELERKKVDELRHQVGYKICKGEELERKKVSEAEIANQLDKTPLETHPRLLKKIIADFLRHRVSPKGGGVSAKALERYLVAIAEAAIKVE